MRYMHIESRDGCVEGGGARNQTVATFAQAFLTALESSMLMFEWSSFTFFHEFVGIPLCM